jgi:hypothetical protein
LSWPAQVRDISAFGIGLLVPRRFEPGTLLSMTLENSAQNVARHVVARVIHATAQNGGRWRLGCALACELSDEELRPFAIQRVEPSGPDVRAWVRYSCNLDVVCRREGGATTGPWSGKIVNVSPGGLGLVISWPAEVGSLLTVELTGVGAERQRPFLVRLAQSPRREATGWLVGCEFTQPFSDDDLERLVAHGPAAG